MLFAKAPFTLMAPGAAVLCISTWQYGLEIKTKVSIDLEQLKATVITFTREKSVLVSTLETVLDMETLMVIQAGCHCPA